MYIVSSQESNNFYCWNCKQWHNDKPVFYYVSIDGYYMSNSRTCNYNNALQFAESYNKRSVDLYNKSIEQGHKGIFI